jgi:hypothetical protein
MCILLQKPCKSLLGAHITNNNQAFYFQAGWGRLEMKPHEKKNRYKTRAKKKKKTKDDKKTKSKKRGEKTIKH